jgi:hypothetical protein
MTLSLDIKIGDSLWIALGGSKTDSNDAIAAN